MREFASILGCLFLVACAAEVPSTDEGDKWWGSDESEDRVRAVAVATLTGCVRAPGMDQLPERHRGSWGLSPFESEDGEEGTWQVDPTTAEAWADNPSCSERDEPFCLEPTRFPSAAPSFPTYSFVVRLEGSYRPARSGWRTCTSEQAWLELLARQMAFGIDDIALTWECDGDVDVVVAQHADDIVGGGALRPGYFRTSEVKDVTRFADTSAGDGRYYEFPGGNRRLPRFDQPAVAYRWDDIYPHIQDDYNGDGSTPKCFGYE